MLNIPFGYWRINVKRFSLQWFLAIHIPVPFIIALRIFTDIGFEWQSYVFLVASFFVGQKIGGLIHKYLDKMGDVGSCLVMDLKRIISHH
ncbi:MAG: hypothetical protein C0597_06220 [Marinilabiliales bacterium]|nr:MAG: hypothetical protein C0597_06220 [Marinilabiliales bacterium]